MKILHFADIHAQGHDLEEIKKCGCFILDQAQRENPDLIVFSGDAFERSDVKFDSDPVRFIFYLFSRLADIAPVSAIIGTPFHDGRAIEVLEHVQAAFPIRVTAGSPEQLCLYDGDFSLVHPANKIVPDIIISAMPAPTKKWFKTESSIQVGETEISKELTKIFAGFATLAEQYDCPHILNGHFNVSGSFVSGTQTLTGVDIEVSRDQIGMGNFDLAALGHIHQNQLIGDNIFFSGGVANHTWGEMGAKGFYIHELTNIPD